MDELVQSLMKRVEQLEAEVKKLKAKIHDANLPEIQYRTGMTFSNEVGLGQR